MTYTRVEAGYARIMKLAMESDFPAKIEEWKAHLDQGRITTEMYDLFTIMGYPLPKADRRRKHPKVSEEVPPDTSGDATFEDFDALPKTFSGFAPVVEEVLPTVSVENVDR